MSVDLSKMVCDEDGYKYLPYESVSKMDVFTLNLTPVVVNLFHYSEAGDEAILIEAEISNVKYDHKVNPQFDSLDDIATFNVTIRSVDDDVDSIFPYGTFKRYSFEYTKTPQYSAEIFIFKDIFNRLFTSLDSVKGLALPIPNGIIDFGIEYPILGKLRFSHSYNLL